MQKEHSPKSKNCFMESGEGENFEKCSMCWGALANAAFFIINLTNFISMTGSKPRYNRYMRCRDPGFSTATVFIIHVMYCYVGYMMQLFFQEHSTANHSTRFLLLIQIRPIACGGGANCCSGPYKYKDSFRVINTCVLLTTVWFASWQSRPVPSKNVMIIMKIITAKWISEWQVLH